MYVIAMDIVGLTIDGDMKDHVALRTIKISKWINPDNLSLYVVFRLTIEHIKGKNEFRNLKELYVYFRKEDLDDIDEESITWLEREEGSEGKIEERKLKQKISPLKKPTPRIPIKQVDITGNGEKKR